MRSVEHNAGFTLVEILIATLILGLTLVPAMQALQSSMQATQIHNSSVVQHYYLLEKMEEVLAASFLSLDTAASAAGSATNASSFSDPAPSADDPPQRLVYLSRYDVDNADADNNPFTDTEDDLIWVRVEIANSNLSFETITAP